MEIALLLSGVGVPAAVASAVGLAVWRPWRGPVTGAPRLWHGGLALAAGYAVGHVTISGWPAPWPKSATHWLLHLVGMALLLVATLERCPAPVRAGGRALAAALAAVLLFGGQVGGLAPAPAFGWLATMTVVVLVWWWSHDRLVAVLPIRPLTVVLGLEAAAFGAVFSNCYDLQAGQLVGALGGALAGLAWIGWRWPASCDFRPAVPVWCLVLAPLLTVQHADFFGAVPASASVPLALLPVIVLLVARGLQRPGGGRGWWVLVPTLAVAGAAVWASWPTEPYGY